MSPHLIVAQHAFLKPLGVYDVEYAERTAPECHGRLRADEEGIMRIARSFPSRMPFLMTWVVTPLSFCVGDCSRYYRAQCVSCWFP